MYFFMFFKNMFSTNILCPKCCTFLLQNQETEIRQDRHLFPLQPVFEIIGSVVEATRLGRANELDVTLSFSSLTGSKSSSLKLARKGDGGGGPVATEVTVDERSPLASFARKAEGRSDDATVQEERLTFDYPRFLHHLLRTIKAGLERAKVSPDWPKNISFQVKSQAKIYFSKV